VPGRRKARVGSVVRTYDLVSDLLQEFLPSVRHAQLSSVQRMTHRLQAKPAHALGTVALYYLAPKSVLHTLGGPLHALLSAWVLKLLHPERAPSRAIVAANSVMVFMLCLRGCAELQRNCMP